VLFNLLTACHLLSNRTQATPEGAKQGERFGIGMIGWASANEAGAVIKGQLQSDWSTPLTLLMSSF
jgi:hypothetical protein